MKVKVCGMRDAANICEIALLRPDYMGFIFYDRSPRFIGNIDPECLDAILPETKRVGVFVNAPERHVRETALKYNLDYVQLHGSESPGMCVSLRKDVGVIKAFGIEQLQDLGLAAEYEGACDMYLFDTKTTQYGGSGQKFDHSLLAGYTGATPYLLSGGLSAGDAGIVATVSDPRLIGADINSRFETASGLKDPQMVKQFIETIKLNAI